MKSILPIIRKYALYREEPLCVSPCKNSVQLCVITLLHNFDALLQVTRDHRFVTARHCLQNLWKVGAAGKPHQQMLLDGLQRRFHECITEKNCTLIRYDIIQGLKNLYDQLPDAAVSGDPIRQKALALIDTEQDPKYRKKYARVWK